jgi:hypothetical protein
MSLFEWVNLCRYAVMNIDDDFPPRPDFNAGGAVQV